MKFRILKSAFACIAMIVLWSCSVAENDPTITASSAATSSSSQVASSSSQACNNSYGTNTMTDCRDGQSYLTVVIGTQVWMAQNLNLATANGSHCDADSSGSCTTYGHLYDYPSALRACPHGWHLPDTLEWNALELNVGGTKVAGMTLRSIAGWQTGGVAGANNYGFNALPGGYDFNNEITDVGNSGNWWTATTEGNTDAYARVIYLTSAFVVHTNNDQSYGFSVRCVEDP